MAGAPSESPEERMTICPRCDGTGKVPSIVVGKDFEPVNCKLCKGSGHIYGEAITGDRLKGMGIPNRHCRICRADLFVDSKGEMEQLSPERIRSPPHVHEPI